MVKTWPNNLEVMGSSLWTTTLRFMLKVRVVSENTKSQEISSLGNDAYAVLFGFSFWYYSFEIGFLGNHGFVADICSFISLSQNVNSDVSSDVQMASKIILCWVQFRFAILASKYQSELFICAILVFYVALLRFIHITFSECEFRCQQNETVGFSHNLGNCLFHALVRIMSSRPEFKSSGRRGYYLSNEFSTSKIYRSESALSKQLDWIPLSLNLSCLALPLPYQNPSAIISQQGGANAGRTIYNAEGKKFALHLVPLGILNEETVCVIGNWVVVHSPGWFEEIDGLESNGVSCKGRILVSDRAHLLFDFHQVVDGLREAELANSFIGTTKRGIGPCYSSKVIRNGIRICDLRHMDTLPQKLDLLLSDAALRFQGFKYSPDMLKEEVEKYKRFVERLEPFIAGTVHVVNESIAQKKKILVEVKAYTTRVGSGPFPTEILGKGGDLLGFAGQEFGTTTGRPRRCGWLDVVEYEVLPGWQCDISKVRNYSDLPKAAREYVERIEELVGIPIHYIGVGPGRDALIYK
ncbi:hypothetical protein TEA_013772 [Camellia sinensis var. sinensis]|uniref:Adenylosuccinate synthetase, chloroplastic n=1 Tax=Camellia sinensis var. sinensis TaxID=542762 RepID=A0A4S4EUK4_CAMSN|nr:hypothetical protein TEA_013772 [Camellia sinensis var. sinensis]